MGTNFYTSTGEHIGKQSSIGAYCFQCNGRIYNRFWLCQKCDRKRETVAHMWAWAMQPEEFLQMKRRFFTDEYGERYNFRAMIAMIMTARVVRFDSIGQEFS